ncbi:MAG: alpha/beta fold hydrolase [Candidatus Woesearchaeota archaeon]
MHLKGVADYLKFMKEVLRPVPMPGWSTANRPVLTSDSFILRDFSLDRNVIPTMIIPPQAGHHSSIADYGKGQSLAECLLDNGKTSVYVTEWLGAAQRRKNETIDDFILAMDRMVDASGGKVNLIGLCQGGWQSAIYASLFPEKVSSLVVAAAPIDFRVGDGKIQFYADNYPMSFYEYLVNLGSGNMNGRFMVTGFKMLNPYDRFFNDYWDLYDNINDEKFMERHRKFRDWYEWAQDIPGKFYLQIVKELFKENRLIKGELEVMGRTVDMKAIGCPLYLIAGEKDDITLPEQVFNMEKCVSSKRIEKMVVPAGHIGVFMGSRILKDWWPKIIAEL